MRFGFATKPAKPPDQPRILIANCYQDEDFARKLAFALRRDRVSPYVAVNEMTAGESLVRRLASTTLPVDCVVPVISIISVTHNWVEREMAQVVSGEINKRKIRACPTKVDNCAVPVSLMGRFVADFYVLGWDQAYEALKTAIQRQPGAERPTFSRPPAHAPKLVAREEELAPTPAGTKQVYLSFDHERDGYYKDVLVTWSKMPGFARFWINDQPPTVPVDSPDAEPYKEALAQRIGAASGILCILGEQSSTNGWMEWEIKRADQFGKRVIAVRINRDVAVPELLSDMGATCAMSFTFEGIRRAIEEAYGETSLD
jgi:hypothetical protein